MRLNDPKFGYHWLWMFPVYYVMKAPADIKNKITKLKKQFKNDSPEIKRLKELSGIS